MKKKILAIALCAVLLIIAIAGASLAYLTDTDEQTNTFTSGNVDIKLDECVVTIDENDNLVPNGDQRTSEDQDYGKLYPAQTIVKDPTITNIGSEDAYIAAKVTVTASDLYSLIGVAGVDMLDINRIVSGGLIDKNATVKDYPISGAIPVFGDDTYSIYQQKEGSAYVFYFFLENPIAKNNHVTLFDLITIPKEWKNDDMAKIVDLKIHVKAYAVQTKTFDSCFEAITAAFPNDFAFVTAP